MAQAVRRKCTAKGKPAPPSSPARYFREGFDDVTARGGSEPVLMLVSSILINLVGSRERLARRRHSRASFEPRVGVHRFSFEPAGTVVFSCGESCKEIIVSEFA
jgi:hypothetical protein